MLLELLRQDMAQQLDPSAAPAGEPRKQCPALADWQWNPVDYAAAGGESEARNRANREFAQRMNAQLKKLTFKECRKEAEDAKGNYELAEAKLREMNEAKLRANAARARRPAKKAKMADNRC